ncbi:MAG TPA: M17 family peptidase N-terminal domain-containing protein, partial [Burkholderiaceae bacterium]|nr:M17 family peptidase N-terminal domain-containing protein [Burkholderiaceae bacterium]
MQFSTKTTAPERIRAQCLVLPVRAGKTLTETGGAIDAAHDGRLSAALKSGDLQAKAGSTLLVAGAGGIARFLLVSTGEAAEASD